MPTWMITLANGCRTMWIASLHDPVVLACNLGSIAALAFSAVLVVKTVRLRRSIRARLRARALARQGLPCVPPSASPSTPLR